MRQSQARLRHARHPQPRPYRRRRQRARQQHHRRRPSRCCPPARQSQPQAGARPEIGRQRMTKLPQPRRSCSGPAGSGTADVARSCRGRAPRGRPRRAAMSSSRSMDGREAAITVAPGRAAPGCGSVLAGGGGARGSGERVLWAATLEPRLEFFLSTLEATHLERADLSGPEWGGMAEGEQSDRRAKVLADYRKTLLQHKEVDAKARRPSTSTACAGCARCRRALPCSPRRAGAVDARGGEEAAQGLRQDGGRPQGAAVGRADHRRGASPAAELRRPRPRPRRRLVRRSQTPVSSSPPARPAARASLLRPRALVASSPWLR